MNYLQDLKTGWYMIGGEKAYCIIREKDVYVQYENSWTCAFHQTFWRWPIQWLGDYGETWFDTDRCLPMINRTSRMGYAEAVDLRNGEIVCPGVITITLRKGEWHVRWYKVVDYPPRMGRGKWIESTDPPMWWRLSARRPDLR